MAATKVTAQLELTQSVVEAVIGEWSAQVQDALEGRDNTALVTIAARYKAFFKQYDKYSSKVVSGNGTFKKKFVEHAVACGDGAVEP